MKSHHSFIHSFIHSFTIHTYIMRHNLICDWKSNIIIYIACRLMPWYFQLIRLTNWSSCLVHQVAPLYRLAPPSGQPEPRYVRLALWPGGVAPARCRRPAGNIQVQRGQCVHAISYPYSWTPFTDTRSVLLLFNRLHRGHYLPYQYTHFYFR